MEEKPYKLQVELVCPGCSRGTCYEHISHQVLIDPKSGLKAEAICVCKNHSTNN